MRTRASKLALVIPVYNEEGLVATSLPDILRNAREAAYGEVDLIAVDDGSTDGTRQALAGLSVQDTSIRFISFTRNFGKEAAIHAGLRHAFDVTTADAFVVMDADLQHPPSLIQPMLEHWRAGCDVVEATKRQRGRESLWRRVSAGLFYRTFSRLSGLRLDQDTDFKLLDRSVVAALLQMGERARFFRGIVRWLGFPSARVEFDVPARAAGSTAWSITGLARYAWRNLTSFSSAPMGVVTVLGAIGLLVGAVLGAIAIIDKLQGRALSGFSTVILLQIFFSSLMLLSLGIIGSYIARIYDEIKRRPHYVLRPSDRRSQSDPSEGKPHG